MSHLFQALARRVDDWRATNCPCQDHPAIREILEFAVEDDNSGQLRYLRKAQLRALETYWYLRLVLGTPEIPKLYETLFPSHRERREAMGLTSHDLLELIADEGLDAFLAHLKMDDALVRRHKLESSTAPKAPGWSSSYRSTTPSRRSTARPCGWS
jgi:type III restriction enzyme